MRGALFLYWRMAAGPRGDVPLARARAEARCHCAGGSTLVVSWRAAGLIASHLSDDAGHGSSGAHDDECGGNACDGKHDDDGDGDGNDGDDGYGNDGEVVGDGDDLW